MGQNYFYCEKIIAVLFVLCRFFIVLFGNACCEFWLVGLPITLLVLTSFWIIVSTSFEVSPNQAANSKD
jgi:hypothetical protein